MLEACHTLGLKVKQGDGISYLKKQSDESFIIISAFHVVEHISFENLQILVQEALRVLKPGGILIMETPNPENIKVATENFYLDPTHIKPIPSGLLSFLPEFYGFVRTKTLRLQEPKELHTKENITLQEVLGDVSPDYAVIAQKNANKKVLKSFDEVFSEDFGLSLSSLTEKFEHRLLNIEAKTTQAEANAAGAEQRATQDEANYHMILNSNSWKLTKPLRLAGKFVRWFKAGFYHWITFSPTSRPRRIVSKLLNNMKFLISRNDKLKIIVKNILTKFPKIEEKISQLSNPGLHDIEAQLPNIRNEEFYLKIKTEVESRKKL